MSSAFSCRRRHQSCDSEQIVGGGDQIGVHLHPLAAPVAGLTQAADGLHPTERLLDAFTDPLANRVTRMPGGSCIEGGPTGPGIILRYVRGNSERAATRDERSEERRVGKECRSR